MSIGFRMLIGLLAIGLVAGCGDPRHPRYTIAALSSPDQLPRWVRLDSVTGEMQVCREAPLSAAGTIPPPPPGFIIDPQYVCKVAATGIVLRFDKNGDPVK